MKTQALALNRDGWSRGLMVIAAISALALSLLAISPSRVLAYTPGEGGHPTSGESSDLMGGTATFTFQTNATLTCDSDDTASGFSFHIDYDVTGTLASGASLVVYLSPNNGAIQGNANGDPDGYIADVESNFAVVDISGLSGSGTLDVDLSITSPFTLSTGGVLGVIANEADETIVSNSKTNSLNCTEAPGHTPTPTPSPSDSSSPTPTQSVAPSNTPGQSSSPTETPEGSVLPGTGTPAPSNSPEGGVKGATGTPAPTPPDTSVLGTNTTVPTVLFVLVLLASLGGLAYLNIGSARQRD